MTKTNTTAAPAARSGIVFNAVVKVISPITQGVDKNGNPYVTFDGEIVSASGQGRVHKLRTAMFHQVSGMFPKSKGKTFDARVALNGGSATVVGAPKIAEPAAA